jgi:hypothetical protein
LTVGTQIQKTLATAESLLATLKIFELETQDENAKALYNSLIHSQQTIVDCINARLEYVKNQEPQYRNS